MTMRLLYLPPKVVSLLAPAAAAPPLSTTPFLGHPLAAGFPSPAADFVESALDLNELLVLHREASFFFRVAGDSMCNAGILDDDIVLVDRAVNPVHGHIVLAVLDGECTLKRLHRAGGVIELHPDNPTFAPIRLADGQQLEMWGVVTAVVRKLRM